MRAFHVLLAGMTLAGVSHARAEVKAKTLMCQVSYSWPKGDDDLNFDNLPPVSVKTVRDIDAPRMNAKAKQVTSDGRYEIDMRAMQPLKGDLTKYEQIHLDITDLKTKTYIIPGDIAIAKTDHNINHAAISVMPESEDDKPAHGLEVECDLK